MSLIKSSLQADFSAHEYVSECQDFIEWKLHIFLIGFLRQFVHGQLLIL